MWLFDPWSPLSLFHLFKPFFSFSGGATKEATRQEDIARQRESAQATLNNLLAQLVAGSPEYAELSTAGGSYVQGISGPEDEEALIRALGQRSIQQQQARIGAGGAATPLEERTNRAFQGLRDVAAFRPEESSVFSALRGTPFEGEQGVTGQVFADLVARAQRPEEFFQSTLGPQLALAQEQVKARAAQRGILGSGLELENLGRTGAELAIREAQAREQFRQTQLANFTDLYNVGQGLRGREIGLEEALLNLQQGRESKLTDLLNASSFSRGSDTANLFQRQTGRAEDLYGAAVASDAARNRQLGQLIGTGVGAAGGFFLGGPAGAMTGAQLGGTLGGGGVPDFLATQRGQAGEGGIPPDLASTLRRTPGTGGMSADDFARLLRGGGY